MSKTKSFVAFGCSHVPLHDQAHLDWVCEIIRNVQPDCVVHQGDLFEAQSVSRFKPKNGKPSWYDWSLRDELVLGHELLCHVEYVAREANPNVELVHTEGNHGYNIRDWARCGVDLSGLCDYREFERSSEGVNFPNLYKRWKWVPYLNDRDRGVHRIGPVCIGHGFKAGKNADRNMAVEFCEPYGLYVGVHLHAPAPVRQVHWLSPLPYFHCNSGCSRDIWDVHYMEKLNRQGWGQGVTVGGTTISRYPSMIHKSVQWEAEVLVRKMFNDQPALMHNEVPR